MEQTLSTSIRLESLEMVPKAEDWNVPVATNTHLLGTIVTAREEQGKFAQ